MEAIDTMLILFGLLAVIIGAVMFIVACVTKKKKKISLSFVLIGIVMIIIDAAVFPETSDMSENTSSTAKSVITDDEKEKNITTEVPSKSEEELQYERAMSSYKPTRDSTIGSVYIGNGQIIEYSTNSIAVMAYALDNETEYNKDALIEKYDNSYMPVFGKITEIAQNGQIQVLCTDEEATEALDKLWPVMSYGYVELVDEQKNLLGQLKKDDEVYIYAKVDVGSYVNIGMKWFECYDGILVQYNGSDVNPPKITSISDGIHTY